MSDSRDERNRAHRLGAVNAGPGLGFGFGPASGGLAASWPGTGLWPPAPVHAIVYPAVTPAG